MSEDGDSSDLSTISEDDMTGLRVTRASERERMVLYPDNPAESYILLYTDQYLADDNVWRRRYYPVHVPEDESDVQTKAAGRTGAQEQSQ